jgi:hypothetical protein
MSGRQRRQIDCGTVQKKIRVGMSSAEVAEVLGAPIIVSTDEERGRSWIYDKIASDVTYSNSEAEGGLFLLITGFGGSGRSGAASSIATHADRHREVRQRQ